jgi:hypothetical protein
MNMGVADWMDKIPPDDGTVRANPLDVLDVVVVVPPP